MKNALASGHGVAVGEADGELWLALGDGAGEDVPGDGLTGGVELMLGDCVLGAGENRRTCWCVGAR